MDAEQKQKTGFILICFILLGYLTFYNPFEEEEKGEGDNKKADQKVAKTFLDKQRDIALTKRTTGHNSFTLENEDVRCVFSPTGARMTGFTHKKLTSDAAKKDPLSLWNSNCSHDNIGKLTPQGKNTALSVSDLDFNRVKNKDKHSITFSYEHLPNKSASLQVTYRLVKQGNASILEREIKGKGWKESNVQHRIYRAVPQQGKDRNNIHRDSSLRKIYVNYAQNDSWNYQSKSVAKKDIGNPDWVSIMGEHSINGIILSQNGKTHIGIAEIEPPVKGEDNSKRPDLPGNTLKEVGITVTTSTDQLKKGYKTGYYFGPNTPEALAAVDQHYKQYKLNFKDNYYYGPRFFGSVNKYVLYPSFMFLYKHTGNPVSALLLLLLIIALFSFFFVYKNYIATIKQKAIKPFITAMKAKGGENLRMQESQFYKKVGVNPFGMFVMGLFNVFLFIGMFNLLNYNIHFRHAKFIWIKDLSRVDATWQLPIYIKYWGQHISCLGLLTFAVSLFSTYFDKYREKLKNPLAAQQAKISSQGDAADNPLKIPKPVEYFLKVMLPLLILNNRTAAITLFRLFNIFIERTQKLICSMLVDENQLRQDVTEKAEEVSRELEQQNTNSRVMSRLEQRLAKKQR